jgi:hypothetical protein
VDGRRSWVGELWFLQPEVDGRGSRDVVTLRDNVEEAHLSIADNKTLQENVEDNKPIIVLEDVKVTK